MAQTPRLDVRIGKGTAAGHRLLRAEAKPTQGLMTAVPFTIVLQLEGAWQNNSSRSFHCHRTIHCCSSAAKLRTAAVIRNAPLMTQRGGGARLLQLILTALSRRKPTWLSCYLESTGADILIINVINAIDGLHLNTAALALDS